MYLAALLVAGAALRTLVPLPGDPGRQNHGTDTAARPARSHSFGLQSFARQGS